MHDRLRLDVAVSEGREIYSWHGEARFTSADVSEVVRTGPISSGSFVGFLHNIFLGLGTKFSYTGESTLDGLKAYNFAYVVPLAHSGYHVQTRSGKPVAPYHGSFSIAASDYRLLKLQVIADAIPSDSPICSAETHIAYQVVSISGRPSLIPATFILDLVDEQHVRTVSSSAYFQCREFRGESTLHFDISDPSESPGKKPAKQDPWLPAGLHLRISLAGPISDRTSYIGDPADGVLLRPVRFSGTTIPKGAVLHGILTRFESHYLPRDHQIFSVMFSRLSSSAGSFLLNAFPKTSNHDGSLLRDLYGSPLPAFIAEEYRKGLFVVPSAHIHIDRNFTGEWITRNASQPPGASPPP